MKSPSIEVAYAAATYAAATGAPVGPNLFAYRSEAQLLIAAAVYESFGGKRMAWRRVAIAVFCPNDKNKIASLDMGVRHRQKRNAFDPVLFAACKQAAAQKQLIRTKRLPEPEPVMRWPAKKPITVVRRDPPPPLRPPIAVPPGARQIAKPVSAIDKEIYGAPLIAPRKIDPRAAYPTMPIPGDKPEGWTPPPEPDDSDVDSEVMRVPSPNSERLGHREGARSKKITLPRIRALEKEFPNDE